MNSSSEDSEEDESHARFAEALDVRFINDSMYSDVKELAVKVQEQPKPLPSKRPVEEESISYSFHLKVTPEFQSHVSKQLSEFLDKQIKEVKKKEQVKYIHNNSEDKSGIYLFSNSEAYLNSEDSSKDIVPSKRPKLKSKTDKEIKKNIAEVVVSPEWVLKQEGTKGWQKNAKKSILYSYKKKMDGFLEYVSESS